MKSKLKKIFFPNETDGIILSASISLLAVVAVLAGQAIYVDLYRRFDFSEIVLPLAWGLYLGTVVGMGTIVADGKRRSWLKWVLSGCFLATLGSYFAISNSYGFWDAININQNYRGSRGKLFWMVYANWTTLLVVVVLFVVSILGTIGVTLVFRGVKCWLNRLRINRTKMMIGLAAVLATVVIGRNVLEQSNQDLTFLSFISFYSKVSLDDMGSVAQVMLGLLVMFFTVFLPGWFLNSIRPSWIRGICALIYYPVLVIVAGAIADISIHVEPDLVLVPVVSAITFCLAHILIAYRKPDAFSFANSSSAEIEESTERRKRKIAWPGHWSVIPVLAVVAVGIFLYRYDPIVLLADPTRLNWSDARRSRQLSRKSNAHVQIIKHPYGTYIKVACNENTHSDFLDQLEGSKSTIFEILNCHEGIDFGLAPINSEIWIRSGDISSAQIMDMGRSGGEVTVGEVNLVGKASVEKSTYGGNDLTIDQSDDFSIEHLLSGTDFSNSNLTISILGKMTPGDVEELKNASSVGNVKIYRGWLPNGTHFDNWDAYVRLAVETNIEFSFWHTRWSEDHQRLLVMILLSKRLNLGFESDAAFISGLKDGPLCFDSPSDGAAATKMFFPIHEPNILEQLAEERPGLTTLVMDLSWCASAQNKSFINVRPDKNFDTALEKFSGLDELHLSDGQKVDSLDFLAKLKKLKTIQISIPPKPKTKTGLDVCQTLEHVILLRAPSAATIKQLQNLPNLKKLVVLDSEYLYLTPAAGKKKLSAALPGVAIQVFDPATYKPQVSQEFKDHIKRMRKEFLDGKDLLELGRQPNPSEGGF